MTCGLRLNKAVLLCLLALLTAVPCSRAAENFHWEHDYNAAKSASLETGKPILAVFSASWCGPCRRLKSTTLADPQVTSYLAEHYVPLMIDTDANRAVTRQFGVTALPTVMVIDPVTENATRDRGYSSSRDFLSFLARNKREIQIVSSQKMSGDKTIEQTETLPVNTSAKLLTPYCLVTMVEEGKLVNGKENLQLVHNGLTVRFTSQATLETFRKTPEKFWPELQGNCPVMFKEHSQLMLGEARWAVAFDDHLYFCHTREHAQAFMQNPQRYSTSDISVSQRKPSASQTIVN